jgi:hypothetical protein
VASNGTIVIQDFLNIGKLDQKLKRGTHAHIKHGNIKKTTCKSLLREEKQARKKKSGIRYIERISRTPNIYLLHSLYSYLLLGNHTSDQSLYRERSQQFILHLVLM